MFICFGLDAPLEGEERFLGCILGRACGVLLGFARALVLLIMFGGWLLGFAGHVRLVAVVCVYVDDTW